MGSPSAVVMKATRGWASADPAAPVWALPAETVRAAGTRTTGPVRSRVHDATPSVRSRMRTAVARCTEIADPHRDCGVADAGAGASAAPTQQVLFFHQNRVSEVWRDYHTVGGKVRVRGPAASCGAAVT